MVKRSTLVVFWLMFFFLIFTVTRITLYFLYPYLFSSLSAPQFFYSLLQGVRFDASVLLLFASPLCLVLLLPIDNRGWIYFWNGIAAFLAIGFAYCLMVDTVYFGFVHRHIAGELYPAVREKEFMINAILEYKWVASAFLIICTVLTTLYFRCLKKTSFKPEKRLVLKIIFLCIFSFIGIRGSFALKPIAAIDAYKYGAEMGSLMLNGIFSVYRYGNSRTEVISYMPYEKALSVLGLEDNEYPFLKKFDKKEHRNVVLIILESWSAGYVDSYGSDYGCTPNFDRFSKDGVLFMRHYAAERRSIDGIQALLTGIPPIKNIPSLGFGLEMQLNGDFMGAIAGKNGFDTLFMQTSKRGSFYMDSIAKALGFKNYFGMEDFSETLLKYPNPMASAFGWDYEGFLFLHKIVNKLFYSNRKPFLAVFFSGTTHTPYPPLPPEFNKYNSKEGEEKAFLNTLCYSDMSLGAFIERAAEEEWFKDTIFIVTADHTVGKFEKAEFPQNFHVPLLIYAPSLYKPQKVDYITSHLDMLPTIASISGISGEFGTVGENVFDENSSKRAFISTGGISGLIKNNGWVYTVGGNTTSFAEKAEDTTEFYREDALLELYALEQLASVLIAENRWGK